MKIRGRCVKVRKLYAPKGQHHIAQGSALGYVVLGFQPALIEF